MQGHAHRTEYGSGGDIVVDVKEQNIKLGLKFQNVRMAIGMSQEEAAHAVDINKDTLSNYETGKTKMPALTCRNLSKLYGVPVDYIWNDDDEDIAKELHNIIDLSNEREVRYLYNVALGMQALRV